MPTATAEPTVATPAITEPAALELPSLERVTADNSPVYRLLVNDRLAAVPDLYHPLMVWRFVVRPTEIQQTSLPHGRDSVPQTVARVRCVNNLQYDAGLELYAVLSSATFQVDSPPLRLLMPHRRMQLTAELTLDDLRARDPLGGLLLDSAEQLVMLRMFADIGLALALYRQKDSRPA